MAQWSRNPHLYSRFVRIVKFALPLLAIAVLSTVFLVQQEDTFDGQLVFSELDRRSLDDGLTIHNPQITGRSASGGYRISAATAIPDDTNAKEVRFTKLVARTENADGRATELTGNQGIAEIDSEIVTVVGDVVVTTSGGYRVETSKAVARLAEGALDTGPVRVVGPTGQIEAGTLRIEQIVPEDGGPTKEFFFFEKGVKLVHLPDVGTLEE